MKYFEVKVKYVKIDDDGKERKVTELYLVLAETCTDAENKTIDYLKELVRGEFITTKVSESSISDVFENYEHFFKIKVATTIESDSGKEKKVNNYFLSSGSNITEALRFAVENLAQFMTVFSIESTSKSKIIDVIK